MEIKIEGLWKKYGDKTALAGLDLTLKEGICGLLGPNGAGKSTLMNIMSGNLEANSGRVLLDGRDIRSMGAEYRGRLGYMPQQQAFYPGFTSERFLYYVAALRGMDRKRARERVDWALELLSLGDVRRKSIRSLSGGMRQRLLLAQAILDDPEIIILDEPTAGLDPKQRIAVRNLIARLGLQRLILISTHVVSDVEFIAGQLVLLSRGRKAAEGAPAELLKSVEGRVYEAQMSKEDASSAGKYGLVSSIAHSDTGVTVRLISDAAPPIPCAAVRPTLEDVYLYHFGDGGEL